MLGGVRLGEHVHRRLGEALGHHAVALALGAVAGHAVLGKVGRAVGDGNGIERHRRLAVGFRVGVHRQGRQAHAQGHGGQQERNAQAALHVPLSATSERDRRAGGGQQRQAAPDAQHHARVAPGGGQGEAEGVGPVLDDGVLGRNGVGDDGGQQHDAQREDEFETDPLAQPVPAGRGQAIGVPGEQRQPAARARGDDEHHQQQGDLAVEQPAVFGGDQGAVAAVDHAVGNEDAGGDHGQHDRQGHGGEALQGERVGRGRRCAGVDALDGGRLDAGTRAAGVHVACLPGRHFGATEADHQEGGQGAEPDAGHDDVQGVGQYGQEGQVFGGGVARQGTHGEGSGGDGGAQDVLPSCRGGDADIEGDGADERGAGGAPCPDVSHVGILHEREPGLRMPGVGVDAGGLGRGGGEDAHQSGQEDQREPGQRPLQAAHPGGVDGAGNGEEDAASDQDHVGRKL